MSSSQAALSAAVARARALGLAVDEPEILADRSNLLIHLGPSPVVARVATMTAALRGDPTEWLQREVEMVAYLVDQGAPVVPPAPGIPLGPHRHGDYVMTFWTWEPGADAGEVGGRESGEALAQLHEVMLGYPGELPLMGPILNDARHMLRLLSPAEWLSTDLVDAAEVALEGAMTLARLAGDIRPLHGDASLSNLFKTAGGLVWTDFEDVCLGPIAWDLAVLVRSAGADGLDVLRGYGRGATQGDIASLTQARELQAALWSAVLADRSPADRPDAVARLERSLGR